MKKLLVLVATVVGVVAFAATASSATPTERRGALHVTKECSEYNGTVGSFCTITSSNISAIKRGMRVVYLQTPGDGALDSDIVLSSGNGPAAFGHVVLDLSTAQGRVTISGGTAKFRGFQADVVVSVDASGVWHWDGTYSFGLGNDDD